jgi:hypothetical protein
VDPRNEQVEGKRWKGCKYALDERFASSTVLVCGSVHTVQQLRGRDCGDSDILILLQLRLQALSNLSHGMRGG